MFFKIFHNCYLQELSEQQHYAEGGDEEDRGEHNSEYDHEAFLGREDSQTFDQLSPDESKERLA